jgi:hypothetical protein
MTTFDANGALHHDAGTPGAGKFAEQKFKEPVDVSISPRPGRTSPLPSELLSAASEKDLKRLDQKFTNGADSAGLEAFDRAFKTLEAYEQEHGTWEFEPRPEWLTADASALMIDPTVSVPRDRGQGVELRCGVAVVCLYGRFGGGNRECYCDEDDEDGCTGCLGDKLSGQPGYIDDEDDEDDSTYANAYFMIADEGKRAEATRILTVNELGDAAAARDRIVAGAPIWSLGKTPRTYSYKPMVNIRKFQDDVAAADRAADALSKFDAGQFPDETTLAETFAGAPSLRIQSLRNHIRSHDRAVASIAIEESSAAELNAPLTFPGLLTGEPERLVREALDKAFARAERLKNQQQVYSGKLRQQIALMATKPDLQSYVDSSEKRKFQESVWSMPGEGVPADFRGTAYFRAQMTGKVQNSPGFDTLDEAQQQKMIAWSIAN